MEIPRSFKSAVEPNRFMESITELRKICQATRPSIFSDFLSSFYYRVSIYLTWFLLLFKPKADHVTVLSGLITIVGGYFLTLQSPWFIFLGAICFHLFNILDMCDGEVARYNKESNISGQFLDWYMHFVFSASMIIGLTLGAYGVFQNTLVILFGFLALLASLLDKSIVNCGWTVISWARLRAMMTGKHPIKGCDGFEPLELNGAAPKETSITNKPSKFSIEYIVGKIPLLMSMLNQDRWASIILFFLAGINLIASFSSITLEFRHFWIFYSGIFGSLYVIFQVRKIMVKKSLEDGYRRLYANPNPIKLPEDDFF